MKDSKRSALHPASVHRDSSFLDAALASAPIGFAALDRDLRYVHVNDYFAAVNGVPVEAHIGHCAWEVVPEIADAVGPMLRHVLETGEPLTGVQASGAQLGRPNDSRIWEAGIFPVRATTARDSHIAGVGLFITEITERQRALQGSEERFRLLIDSVKDYAILMLGVTGDVTTWNEGARRILGYDSEEILGRHFSVFYPAEEIESGKPQHALEMALRDGRFEDEGWRVRKDGTRLWANVITTALFGPERQLIGFAKVTRDLTERVAMERELGRTHETLRALVNAAPIPITALDPAERVMLWNPAAERLFGWTADEVLGKAIPFASSADAEEYARVKEKVLAGQAVSAMETRRHRKDGSSVDVLLSCAPFHDRAADAFGAVALYLDLTEYRQLEEQLRQSQKMEAVGQLAGGVAHDFNNLLTVIKAYSGLVAEELDEQSPLRRDVVEIQRAAGRAASLTQQLLAFSRKQVLQPRVLDLDVVARGLEPMLRRLINEEIRIVMRPADEVGLVKADPSQIEQVLMNLVVNARDAMPNGGTVTIETANVELDATYLGTHPVVAAGSYVMLAVGDTGIGMDEATRARIFEPFFTTKPAGKGTGLGLSTVYGIVKQSNGYIWAYSEPGLGTTFKVYLPRLDADEVSALVTDESPTLAPMGSETVLLVEDDAAVRSLARRVLERNGYMVLEASDGHDALRVSEQYKQPIGLLLTDVMLPEMNGPSVWSALRKKRPELRVLYMSGYTTGDVAHRGLLDADAAVLQKPFTAADLTRIVRKVLDHSR